MPSLSDYQADLQLLINDTAAQFFQPADLTRFINWSRHRVAALGECIRWLPPSGAGQNQTVASQEVYPFSAVNALIPAGSGMSGVLSVRMVAISSGTFRPAWRQVAWTSNEAWLRSVQRNGSTIEPGIWSQYAQGAAGTIYLYPIPSQANPMDWDCTMLPIDLFSPTDPEAIPAPWTDFITLGALSRVRVAQQRHAEAHAIEQWFLDSLSRARSEASGSVKILHPYASPPA